LFVRFYVFWGIIKGFPPFIVRGYKGVYPLIVFIIDFAVNYKLCTVNYGRSKGTEVILENIVTCLPFIKGNFSKIYVNFKIRGRF